MAIIPPRPNAEFVGEKVPSGTHQAVCQSVHDIGIQETTFNGETKQQHKVVIVWEVNERIAEGKFKGERFVMSRRYTLSLHEKSTLRHDLASWRGRDFTDEELGTFDLEKLIGANCLLSVVETKKGDKTYTNIASVSKLAKGMEKISPELKPDHKFAWIEKLKGTADEPAGNPVVKATAEEVAAGTSNGDPHAEPTDEMHYGDADLKDTDDIPF